MDIAIWMARVETDGSRRGWIGKTKYRRKDRQRYILIEYIQIYIL